MSELTLQQTLRAAHVVPRVNLLPPEVQEGRRFRRVQGGLAAGVVVVLGLLAGVVVLASSSRDAAAADLAATQEQTRRLTAQQAQYADVPRTTAAIDAAAQAQADAMASDVEWYRTLADISTSMPAGVYLKQMQITVQSPTTGAAATPGATSGAAAPLSPPGVATITFQGVAFDHPDVAAWLDALAKRHGFTGAYLTQDAREKVGDRDVQQFTSSVTVTSDALSHRFDRGSTR